MRRSIASGLVVLLLLLAGCAERWSRPGATEAEADATNTACTSEADVAVPPQMVWQIVEGGRMERDRQCWRDGGTERCRTVERYIPPRFGWVDMARGQRDGWRRNCMAEKGFTFQGYRPLRLD